MKTIKIVIPVEMPDDLTPQQLANGLDEIIRVLAYYGNDISPVKKTHEITREISVETRGDGWIRANKFKVHLGRFSIL